MPRSTDPTGIMPPAGPSGSITLTVSPTRAAAKLRLALAVIGVEGIALLFLWWRLNWGRGIFPFMEFLSLFGMAAALLLALYLLTPYFFFPLCLTIGARGITAVRPYRSVTIDWSELGSITLKTVSAGRYQTQTRTILSALDGRRISFLPVYDVAPLALATYIREARADTLGTEAIEIVRIPRT